MMNRTERRMMLGIAALVLLTAGCGRLSDDRPGAGAVDHPTGPRDLVLRIESAGGFLPAQFALREVPSFSLMGDGLVIVRGAEIEIYPPPALPSVQSSTVTREAIQLLLEAAREAGLMGPAPDLGSPPIADASATTFTVFADGRKHVVRAYALSETLEDSGRLTDEQEAARRKLVRFQRKALDLRSWLPEGSVGPERPHDFDELRVFVFPEAQTEPPDEQPQEPKAWPLASPLAEFGNPLGDERGVRCGTVRGSDLERLLKEAAPSNTLTPWTSGGEEYYLVFRPLMPDEFGCPDRLYPPH